MKIIFLTLAAISLVGAGKCTRSSDPVQDHSPLISLETYGCRGYCPTYKLMFRNDGFVEYEGVRNMVKMGKDTIRLTPAELKKLKTAVAEVNLWQYPERIETQVADAPPSLLTVYDGEKSHGVLGSVGRPKPIVSFEEVLKDLVEAHGLKVKEGVNPYEAPPNQQEIIVKFKPEINPGNFMMKFEEIRLRIVRRVSAENQWIIGFNPDQITEKQLIEMLKGMDGVLEVVSNKKQ